MSVRLTPTCAGTATAAQAAAQYVLECCHLPPSPASPWFQLFSQSQSRRVLHSFRSYVSTIMDPLSICASAANIAQLCGAIITKLASFCEATSHVDITVSGFRVEISNFQMALRLVAGIQSTFRAPAVQGIEEDHWRRINKLLARCRQTLARLEKLLNDSEAKQTTLGRKPITQLRLNMRSHLICILRSHIKSYTQALQVSLSTLTLVNQWQSRASIESELRGLQQSIQDVKAALSAKRPSVVEEIDDIGEADTEIDIPNDLEVKVDVEEILSSAEAVRDATTAYQPDAESIADRLRFTSPVQNWINNGMGSPLQSPGGVASPGNDARSMAFPSSSELVPPAPAGPRDSGVGSDTTSDFDPDPDHDDHFSQAVLEGLVEKFKKQAILEYDVGNYHRAETAQVMMIKYLDEGKEHHEMSYDRAEVYEQLAQIYYKQKQLENAKSIYNGLLSDHKERLPDVWRWYYFLAKIYQEQDKLDLAGRFAKRAFTGCEKHLDKQDPLVFESVTLFAQICQQRGEHTLADALREQYLGTKPGDRPRVPSLTDPKLVLETTPSGGSGITWLAQAGHDPLSPNFSSKDAMRYSIERDSESAVTTILQQIKNVEIQRDLAKESLKWAIQQGRRTIASVLMDPDNGIGKDSLFANGKTPLIYAIEQKKDEIVQDILQREASPEIRCEKGVTPLIYAVDSKHEGIVALLLGKGARVDATTYGWTALHRAVDRQSSAMVKLLLANDASLELPGPKKWSPSSSSADSSWTPLLMAAHNGLSEIAHILLERHANIEARSSTGATPLMLAAEERHATVVRLFLAASASVHAVDKKGDTALHRAVRKGWSAAEIVGSLLDKEADVDAANKEKETPLHVAASKSTSERLVSSLLDRQAKIEARDIAGRTPLHVAIEKRQEGNVVALLERGADVNATDNINQSSWKLAQRSSPEIQTIVKRFKKRSTTGTISRRSSAQSNTPDDASSRGRAESVHTTTSRFSFFNLLDKS